MKPLSWNNIETAERFLRSIIAFAVILFLIQSPAYQNLFAIGYITSLYLLLTALITWDPIYAIFYRVSDAIHLMSKAEKHTDPKIQFSA